MRPLLTRQQCQERLELIFPRASFDPALNSRIAGAAVAALLYVDAVVPDEGDVPEDTFWARPTMVLWMSDVAYALGMTDGFHRFMWRDMAARNRVMLDEIMEQWGETGRNSWYADNSRETLRDETLPELRQRGAVRDRPDIKTSSAKGRWALTESFADLFDPMLKDEALVAAADAWRAAHLGPGELLKIDVARTRQRQAHEVSVALPSGDGTRQLEFGDASLILKGVVEQWAPARLLDPVVLTISEPSRKILLADQKRLTALGLRIDAASLLPDCVIVDVGADPPAFWIVEAVDSDGEIDEDRRDRLLAWAADQRIPPASCHFLSAFVARNSPSSRRRFKDLAAGTYAWYLDEPTRELAWYEMSGAAES